MRVYEKTFSIPVPKEITNIEKDRKKSVLATS